MDQRGQDSIIALGIYLLESNFQHVDHILPYLLKLLNGLGKMQWVDEIKYFPRESKLFLWLINDFFFLFDPSVLLFIGIPVAERMSFCLNTLLTDVATRCPVSREKIIEAQIKCLSKLSNIIRSAKSDKLNDITKSMFLLDI